MSCDNGWSDYVCRVMTKIDRCKIDQNWYKIVMAELTNSGLLIYLLPRLPLLLCVFCRLV